METTELFILITDIIGTIAFAVSGALAGIRKKMDVFGVNILAVLTATGGGVIRDLIIGSTPPAAFSTPRSTTPTPASAGSARSTPRPAP